jgi:polysaccharide biosynthesis transport protein
MESISSGSSGLRENLAIFFRYQSRIKTVFFTTVLISIVGSFLVSKVYEAEAKILIRHHREAKVISTSNVPSNLFTNEAKEKLLSEIQIFKSISVIEKVVENLGPDVVLENMRWRWDWLRELPGKIKESLFKALWAFEPTKNLLHWLGRKQDRPGNNVRKAIGKIADNLTVEPVKGTNVFAVEFAAPDPDFAAQVVNTMVEMYQDFHLELRQGTSENKVFSEQVDRLKGELRQAKENLLTLKHDNGIISVNLQIPLLLERMNANQALMQKTHLDRTETELQIKELQRQLTTQPKFIQLENSWTRNPVLDSLRKKLSKLEMEKTMYVQGSGSAVKLEAEIESIKRRIANEGQIVKDSNKSGINPVYQEIQKDLSMGFKKLYGLEQSYTELENQQQEFERRLQQLDKEKGFIQEQELDIEVKEQALRLFAKKKEENAINSILNNQRISDVTPIELAEVPISASKPKKIKNLVVGIVVGLLGGLLVAYITEFFRRSLANKEEVEKVLSYPCLAAFRFLDKQNAKEAEAHNIFQLKLLDESIRQLSRQKGIQSILVGSTHAGEGKSMVASALAHSLTQKGSRVLLISDKHMDHQPKQEPAEDGGDVNSHGMLQDINIHPAAENSFLYTVNYPETLAETIKKEKSIDFTNFLNKVKESFDYVIVDAPALNDVPEIITPASIVDAVLFVVEAEGTSRISVAKALERLKEAGASIYGVVLNKRIFDIPEWAYDWLLLLNRKY